ncbi:hypothetical protein DSECCO2_642090 [anaerobic digester metagenome]
MVQVDVGQGKVLLPVDEVLDPVDDGRVARQLGQGAGVEFAGGAVVGQDEAGLGRGRREGLDEKIVDLEGAEIHGFGHVLTRQAEDHGQLAVDVLALDEPDQIGPGQVGQPLVHDQQVRGLRKEELQGRRPPAEAGPLDLLLGPQGPQAPFELGVGRDQEEMLAVLHARPPRSGP